MMDKMIREAREAIQLTFGGREAPLIGALNGALNGPLYHPEPVILPVMVLWPVPDLWRGQITSPL